MSNNFTIEEINIIVMYITGSATKTINRIVDILPHMTPDIRFIAVNAIRKLNELTESEFAIMKFISADDTGD